MLSIEQIRKKVLPVLDEFSLEKVEVFGSYADGTATEESDVDFLVKFVDDIPSALDICYLYDCLKNAVGTEIDMVTLPIQAHSKLKINNTVSIYAR